MSRSHWSGPIPAGVLKAVLESNKEKLREYGKHGASVRQLHRRQHEVKISRMLIEAEQMAAANHEDICPVNQD